MSAPDLDTATKSLEFALTGIKTIEGWRVALVDFEKYRALCPDQADQLMMGARDVLSLSLLRFPLSEAVDEFMLALPNVSDPELLFLMLMTVTEFAPKARAARSYLMSTRSQIQSLLIQFARHGATEEELRGQDPNNRQGYKEVLLAIAMMAKSEIPVAT